jgi:hypothetical protein
MGSIEEIKEKITPILHRYGVTRAAFFWIGGKRRK